MDERNKNSHTGLDKAGINDKMGIKMDSTFKVEPILNQSFSRAFLNSFEDL